MKKNKILFLLILTVLSYILSFFVINAKLLNKHVNYTKDLNLTFYQENYEDNSLKFEKNEKVSLDINEFVNYFDFYTESEKSFTYYIIVYDGEKQVQTYENRTNSSINYNSVYIGKNVTKIDISFEKEQSIRKVTINNKLLFISYFQIVFVILSIGVGIIYLVNKENKMTPEILFVIISTTVGLALVFGTPLSTYKSWDDQIHFESAYKYSEKKYSVSSMSFINIDSRGSINNYQESKEYTKFLNKNDNNYIDAVTNGSTNVATISYLPFIISYKIRSILKYDFSIAYYISLLLSLLLYIASIYFAIKNTPKGKYLFLAIGVMPISLFLASNYSYDTPLIALSILGISFALKEIFSDSKKINRYNILISIIAFLVASACKAIYIPLMLLLLFIPKDKFESNKQRMAFNISVILLLVIMFSTFVLPMVSGDVVSDTRGGANVSGIGQIKFILKNPIKFSIIFIKNIFETLFIRMFGVDAIQALAYMSRNKYEINLFYIIYIFTLFVSMIINNNKNEKKFSGKIKLFLVITTIFIICEIYGSLYISFTPVGFDLINGIQSRYFIPLLIPLLLVFNTDSFAIKTDEKKYIKVLSYLYVISIFGSIMYQLLSV